MPAPTPPVPFKEHCSIIHNNILYVYSPQALQTLSLTEGSKWTEEKNGVSVSGAVCVKADVDGDKSKPALFVVGGVANDSGSGYSGLQRYSLDDKTWKTITPVAAVTKHRANHGAAYMNSSSTILVYAGSQDGYSGASSETFLIDTFPPYNVQAYSSLAPPAVQPYMLPWNEDRVLMVGGSDANQNMFTFGPVEGWQDLGLTLPYPLPEQPAAQAALYTLADNSRILQTFKLDVSPVQLTTNVLLNPGGQLATFNETIGSPITTVTVSPTPMPSPRVKRQTYIFNYPPYDPGNSPESKRSGFSIAQADNGLVAFVGGDADSSVAFFNQSGNSFVQATALLGNQPQTSSTPKPTPSPISTSSSFPTAAAASDGGNTRHSLIILGGVLGGVCGLAAILIIILLALRNMRRSKRKELEKERGSPAPDGKAWADFNFEEGGTRPLAKQGQPMGRSPVVSTVGPPVETGKSTMLQPTPFERNLIRRVSSDAMPKEPVLDGRPGYPVGRTRRDKSPLAISKPMNPDLGNYVRPSIDLGRATPASPIAPVNATAMVTAVPVPERNRSQRKTDDAWAKWFSGDRVDPKSSYTSPHTRTKSRDSQGRFWPGTGVVEKMTKPPQLKVRDPDGRAIQPQTVVTSSPTLKSVPSGSKAPNLEGVAGRISSGDSVSSGYSDEKVLDAFSSGIPDSVHDTWSPVDSQSSRQAKGKSQDLAPPTGLSMKTTSSSSATNSSGIPIFPMPTPSARSRLSGGSSTFVSVENVQGPQITALPRKHREPSGYFKPGPGQDGMPNSSDMSWLHLETSHPSQETG